MKDHAKSIVALVITLVVLAVSSGCAFLGGSKSSYGGAVGAVSKNQQIQPDVL